MCATCGCDQSQPPSHHPAPDRQASDPSVRRLRLEQDLLAKNDRHAAANRRWLAGHGMLALNLMASPGAGKTALLVRTLEDLGGEIPFAVIEGDQQTSLDAERIRRGGTRAVQINTGRGCHLDAHQVGHALRALDPAPGAVVMIENVGNLVCPAGFDLGEDAKVVILSVTEGEDKPLKYPHMFRAARLLILSKTDLLPHVDFDPGRCLAHARRINPELEVMALSVRTGEGLAEWYRWLETMRRAKVPVLAAGV